MQNRALQIVRVERLLDGSSTYVFVKEALERIVCHPEIKDKKLCVVSIVGKFRQGKSVAANSFVRYLRHLAKAQANEAQWLSDTPSFDCFEWKTAVDGVTTGIWICPDVVTLKTPDGEEVAVLVMDTQGIDDPNADSDESIVVFGLPLLLSSVYNVKDRISMNELEHAQFYSEYGRMAVETDEGLRPFQ
ncbi:Protein Y54G2A.2 b, partial [Aphelenchoides avenae]